MAGQGTAWTILRSQNAAPSCETPPPGATKRSLRARESEQSGVTCHSMKLTRHSNEDMEESVEREVEDGTPERERQRVAWS